MSGKYFWGLLQILENNPVWKYQGFSTFYKAGQTWWRLFDDDEDDFDEGNKGQKGLGVSYTDCQWGEGSTAAAADGSAAAAAAALLFWALL